MSFPAYILSRIIWLAVLLFVAGTPAIAQAVGKVPPEVINQAASHGTVLVLVGLNVPWQMESTLSEKAVRAQREAIVSVQAHLLTELAGRKYKVIRRYHQVPGIALEVGADALAELARSERVMNVVLDRPGMKPAQEEVRDSGRREVLEAMFPEKVPAHLFSRAANNGTVLVLAGLRVPWQNEDNLSEELMTVQRSAILDAQRYILAELTGTQYRVTRLYRKIPGIALRVGPDALKVLERSPAITNVLLDRQARPVR
jgi:hypothetical protein